jgi:16S rRNA (adenine1518-N6/adenine1519-N6)-dimethyltransferase
MSILKIGEELRALGIRPSKKFGQHFLTDSNLADWIVEKAAIAPGERVLEIGPGLGILTERLHERTPYVIAIETDRRLAEHISGKYTAEVINADVLTIELPKFDKVVSNLPYQISSEITVKLLEHKFKKGLLMYQREFAEHLTASAGTRAYSRISVMSQYRADIRIVKAVSRGVFYPVPKVDSAIVEITPKSPDPIIRSEEEFTAMMTILFAHKNRKVRNGIISEYRRFCLDKKEARKLADDLPHADERPVKLTIPDLIEVTNRFYELKTG